MIDLTQATNVIRVMKEYGNYTGQKIGMIKCNTTSKVSLVSGVPHYCPGQIVLFREEVEHMNSSLGEFNGVKSKPTGRVTIESPLCQAEIDKQRAKGSLITTIGVMINVPVGYVEEIRI